MTALSEGRVLGVKVRDATPGDAEFLAWVMLTAARSHLERGIWDHLFGWDEAETLAFLAELAVTGPTHLFHYSRFLIAEVDGQPASALSGYDPATEGFDVYLPIAIDLLMKRGLTEADLALVMERGAAVTSAMSDAPEACWVVESVATAPDFRRRGLVDTLMAEVLGRARAAGAETAQISVFIGNDPARRAYVKEGFKPVDEKRTPEWEALMGCPGIERLLQQL